MTSFFQGGRGGTINHCAAKGKENKSPFAFAYQRGEISFVLF